MLSPLLRQLLPLILLIVGVIIVFFLIWWFRVHAKKNQPKTFPSYDQDVVLNSLETGPSETPSKKISSLKPNRLKEELTLIDQKLSMLDSPTPTAIPRIIGSLAPVSKVKPVAPRIITRLPNQPAPKPATIHIITKSIKPGKSVSARPAKPIIISSVKSQPSSPTKTVVPSVTPKRVSTGSKPTRQDMDDLTQEINKMRKKLR